MAAKKKTAVQDEQVLDVEITGATEEAIVDETMADSEPMVEVENAPFEGPSDEPKVEPVEAPEPAEEPEPEPSEEEDMVEAPAEEVIIKRLPRRKNNPSMFRKYLISKKFARR